MHLRTPAFFALLAIGLHWQGASAATGCAAAAGRFVSIEGMVEVQAATGGDWRGAVLETGLCEGDTIRVGERSRAAVALINEAVLRIDQGTTLRLVDIKDAPGERSWLDLLKGAYQSFSRKPRLLTVNTPYLNGSIEGTEYVMRVEDKATTLTVLEGTVRATNDQGEVAVGSGESARAAAGEAPTRQIVVRPRDKVQWSVYYPPILSTSAIAASSPSFDQAKECAARGDTTCAFDALDRIPAPQRDGDFLLLRASLLLSVGRVDEAKSDVDAMLSRNAGAGQAYALRSVIAVAQNDNASALADARRGVELSPESAAAKIALSYALQANLDLQAARDALLQAVQEHPRDALAWARLGELWLMLGDRREARAAAERAVALDPELSRTQIVLGFTALSEIRIKQARAAFEKAISLDSSDPLPRLGLGLALIRQGALAEGRGEIEAAVALDSNDSLLRAYLGKAYFEEKRAPLDADQLAIAKDLDPLDPTAFLYDAIRLQTENQPVAALRQLEASIERNDNRAVYRSRLLLDQDRAARGVSLARMYDDLGFVNAGVNVASRSLALDPANASAHRFLSDTYQEVRRRDIARVSELFQAQMLQDTNINPVQPSLSEANLNAGLAFGAAGFNEFTPLFERNRATLGMSGIVGNNDTYGGEAVLAGIYDTLSLSAGAFAYDTDGWRPNNNLRERIYNLYAQWAITANVNIQAEFRRRNTTEGDLAFNFDPDAFLTDKRIERDQDTARAGIRFSPTPSSTFLLSYIYADRDIRGSESESLDPFTTLFIDYETRNPGSQTEGQYIFQRPGFNVIVGGSYSSSDRDIEDRVLIEDVDFGPVFEAGGTTKEEIENPRGYLYTNLVLANQATLTVGASYDAYREDPIDETSFNPKLGIQWLPSDDLTLRAAAFKTVKPSIINNRTLEPTQVAGFNQFFDDANGTEAWRYGVGSEWRTRPDLTLGAELTWRELNQPVVDISSVDGTARAVLEDRSEQLHTLYAYWTPTARIAAKASIVYDLYEADEGIMTEFAGLPTKVETTSVPVALTYFHPSGFFSGAGATYVHQEVVRSEFYPLEQGTDEFFVVDLVFGYRLPKRAGTISLGVRNLFGEEFRYQDDTYREYSDEPSTGPYFPDRTIIAQIGLNF
jgi:tetratricopeptide (TPR) repeat protein